MTDEEVTFADAVDVAVTVLNDAIGAPPAHGLVPNPRPARFYRVRRFGGPRQNRVTDGAQLRVESWGTDDTDASDMAETARHALHAASGTVVNGTTVYLVEELSGPAEMPDLESTQPRVIQNFVFPCRGT